MNRSSIEAVHLVVPLPSGDSPNRTSLLPEIAGRLRDPNASVDEIVRPIAIEIVHIIEAMQTCEEIGTPKSQLKSYLEQVKALRLLSRTFVESYAPAKRDVLNLGGPKFLFVFEKILECFKDALEESTGRPRTDASNQHIMKTFADRIRQRQADIQREVNNIVLPEPIPVWRAPAGEAEAGSSGGQPPEE
jgi:hypothetical protein